MNFKRSLIEFGIVFAIALAVSAIVIWLWSLAFHVAGLVDWETSFLFAIVFGILAAVQAARGSMQKG